MNKGYLVAALCLTSSISFGLDLSECEEKTFMVSAYYSPLATQSFFYQGTFDAETKLNGKGIKGASGQPVINGMIAAPKNYEFGTIIYFPGYGTGKVLDRGGAIVNSGVKDQVYDRIDVWAGKGSEGLMKALSFGKQTLTGYVCGKQSTSIGFSSKAFNIVPNFFEKTFGGITQTVGRKDPWVGILESKLKKLGYLSKADQNFDTETKAAVCKFQVDRALIGENDPQCGTVGPITRSHLVKVATVMDTALLSYDVPQQDNTELPKEHIDTQSLPTSSSTTIIASTSPVKLEISSSTAQPHLLDELFK